MIAPRKRVKIFKGETPYQELQKEFQDEVAEIMKKAALELSVDVEQLKCCFDANGVVGVAIMTEDEMIEREKKRLHQKRVNEIKKMKGLN